MKRSGDGRPTGGLKGQTDYEDIEREFLGISIDMARLREKVMALIARLGPPTSPSCSP